MSQTDRSRHFVEYLHHALAADPQAGLRVWADAFDAARQSWDVSRCEVLLAEVRRSSAGLSPRTRGLALDRHGQWLMQLGEWDGAIRRFEQSLQVFRQAGDVAGKAQSLNGLGNVYQALGRWSEAAACYRQALPLQREIGDRRQEAITLNNLAVVLGDEGRVVDAYGVFEQSLALLREVGSLSEIGRTLLNLGKFAGQLGRFEASYAAYVEALRTLTSAQDVSGQVNALNGLGNYHKRRGELDEAGEFYRRSLALAQEIGDLRDQEQALGNLGTLYHQQGHYDLAEQAYRQARATCLAVSDEAGIALWSGNLAMVLSLLDRASEVLPLLQEQLAINRRLGHRDGEAVALMNLGTHHRDAGDLDAAEAYYHRALTAAEEVGRPALIARITGALGSVAWRRQQFEAAAAAFQRALAIYRELDEPRGEVQMLYKLAGLHYEQEAWQVAYDYAAASWHAAQRFESPYWRGRVLWLLGEAAFERGDDQGAEYLAEAAVQARLADDDPRYGLSLRSILERMLTYYEGGATERAVALARTAITRWQQADAGEMMGDAIDTFQEVVASLLAPT